MASLEASVSREIAWLLEAFQERQSKDLEPQRESRAGRLWCFEAENRGCIEVSSSSIWGHIQGGFSEHVRSNAGQVVSLAPSLGLSCRSGIRHPFAHWTDLFGCFRVALEELCRLQPHELSTLVLRRLSQVLALGLAWEACCD